MKKMIIMLLGILSLNAMEINQQTVKRIFQLYKQEVIKENNLLKASSEFAIKNTSKLVNNLVEHRYVTIEISKNNKVKLEHGIVYYIDLDNDIIINSNLYNPQKKELPSIMYNALYGVVMVYKPTGSIGIITVKDKKYNLSLDYIKKVLNNLV